MKKYLFFFLIFSLTGCASASIKQDTARVLNYECAPKDIVIINKSSAFNDVFDVSYYSHNWYAQCHNKIYWCDASSGSLICNEATPPKQIVNINGKRSN